MDEDWTDEVDPSWVETQNALEQSSLRLRTLNHSVEQGWHVVRIDVDHDRDEVAKWCAENTSNFCHFGWNWAFERESDAVAFVLRWK